MKIAVVLALLLALAACGSPRTEFYELSATAPASADAAPSPCGNRPVSVDRVLLPGILDRQSFVRSGGSDQLEISNKDRWAAPLDQMIQRVLAEDLRDRLPAGDVLAPGDPAPPGGAAGLQVNILRFMPGDAGSVTLRADWSVSGPRGEPLLERSESITAPGGATTGTSVAAMSRVLATFADRIVAAMRNCRSATF